MQPPVSVRQEAPPPPPVQLEPEPVPQPEETFIPPPPPPQTKSEPVSVPDQTGWEDENVYEVPPVDKVNITDEPELEITYNLTFNFRF